MIDVLLLQCAMLMPRVFLLLPEGNVAGLNRLTAYDRLLLSPRFVTAAFCSCRLLQKSYKRDRCMSSEQTLSGLSVITQLLPRKRLLSAAHYLAVIPEVYAAPCVPTFVGQHFAVETHQFVQFGLVTVQPPEHYHLVSHTRD